MFALLLALAYSILFFTMGRDQSLVAIGVLS